MVLPFPKRRNSGESTQAWRAAVRGDNEDKVMLQVHKLISGHRSLEFWLPPYQWFSNFGSALEGPGEQL